MKSLSSFITESIISEKLNISEDKFWFIHKQESNAGNSWNIRESKNNGATTLRSVFIHENELNNLYRINVTNTEGEDPRAEHEIKNDKKNCYNIDEKAFESFFNQGADILSSLNQAGKELKKLAKSAEVIAAGRANQLKDVNVQGSDFVLFQAGRDSLPFIVANYDEKFTNFTGMSVEDGFGFNDSMLHFETERNTAEVIEMQGWKIYSVDQNQAKALYKKLQDIEADFKKLFKDADK